MCPTKTPLNHFLALILSKRALICFSKLYSINSDVFPKFAMFMDPLSVVLMNPVSKKSLFGVIT